jgi:hypothetical protein
MQPYEHPAWPWAQGPVPQEPGRILSVRDVLAGPAGPVRIEVRLVPPAPFMAARPQLSVSGPGIPHARVDRVETASERARRENAEATMAAAGKRPRRAARLSAAGLDEMLNQPDLFSRTWAVSLTVAGSAAELRPRRDLLARASFGVDAQVSGRRYALTQVWWRTARVVRDGRTIARLRRPLSLRSGPRYADDVRWAACADPVDVTMTHTLGSAYRVGSPGFLVSLARWILDPLARY